MQLKQNQGFTLIEIAAVLTIIGLIVGGITVGTSLVNKSRLDSVIAEVKLFTKAAEEFESTYSALPGDISYVTGLPTAMAGTGGNGNGLIDTNAAANDEALNFWLHLSATNLLPGNFNGYAGTTPYRIATPQQAGGIPGSKISRGGFSVTTDSTLGLTYSFSKFTSTANAYTYAILSTTDAYYLDRKYDDGLPSSGYIRAYDGNGLAANSCVTAGSAYNVSNSSNGNVNCYMKVVASIRPSNTTAVVSTCNGSPIGATRISTTTTCPQGTEGQVIETCQSTGTWTVTQQTCQAKKCSFALNKAAGDTITFACPQGSKGVVTKTCQGSGAWKDNSNATPPAMCTTESTCVNPSTTRHVSRNIGCPIGYYGYWVQDCPPSGGAISDQNGCKPIQCSDGSYVGDFWPGAAALMTCTVYSGWSDNATSGGRSYPDPFCMLPITTTITQSTVAATTVGSGMGSDARCTPSYANGCVVGATRTLTQTTWCQGPVQQKCNSAGYWEMISGECKPDNCNGEPLGAFRIAEGSSCPSGSVGQVIEICSYNTTTWLPAWVTSYINCSQIKCPAITNSTAISTEGYATNWPLTNAGAMATAGSCLSGYSGSSTRYCGMDGQWQDAATSCTLIACGAGTHAATNTYWGLAVAGTIAYISPPGTNTSATNYCSTNYFTPEFILRDCSAAGVWSAPVGGLNLDGDCISWLGWMWPGGGY